MSVLSDSRDLIESYAAINDSVVVALDGKDSMVVMDLVRPTFKRVEAFNMVYAFGTERFRKKAEYVKARWGVELKEVDHFGAIDHCNTGYYCLPHAVAGPQSLREAIEKQRQEYGIELVATGARSAESLGRRQMIARGTQPGWHPIADWRKRDVLEYCDRNAIPLVEGEKSMQGISLHRSRILELHRNEPGDYEILRKRFPFIHAIVKREEWYGRTANVA